MKIIDIYQDEIENDDTRYFLIVSGDHEDDIDFEQYTWRRSRYNRVRPGDLFLYRKKQKNNLLKNTFFFYGAGRFKSVVGDDRVKAEVDKAYNFEVFVTQLDLDNYNWHWKNRGNNWAHFFNQYGMDNVPKEDFINILKSGFSEDSKLRSSPTGEFISKMEKSDYYVEDNIAQRQVRQGQSAFSNTVKINYSNKCCVCGISTGSFLIGSHIIPWSERKETRLDPSNGLSLCSFHDKGFDKGYFTLDDHYRIVVTDQINDMILSDLLEAIDKQKIQLPSKHKPKMEYLRYHRENVYESFKS
jgi:putative restriction endonuclease